MQNIKRPNRLSRLLFWPLETPKCVLSSSPAPVFFSACPSAPGLLEPAKTIKLVADQRASRTGHKHFRHFKCAATLLALPHLHMVSPHLSVTKLDQIGGEVSGATGEGGREDARNISPSPSAIFFFWDWLQMQVWCTSQPVWCLRVTLNSAWAQWPNSEERDWV